MPAWCARPSARAASTVAATAACAGSAKRVELGEADEQQRAQFVVAPAERTRDPGLQRVVEARRLAQHGEADRLDQRAVARIGQLSARRGQFGLERTAAMQHRVEHARGDCTRCGAWPLMRSSGRDGR